MKTITTHDLCAWLDTTLDAASFNDYCPNGLQVEGKSSVSYLITGVTASQGEDPRVRGIRKKRLATLLAKDINLIAYHLPLDAHPHLGNNAQLARVLGLTHDAHTTGPNGLVWLGEMPGKATLGEVAAKVEQALGRSPQVIGDASMSAKRLAWCTGAAQSMLEHAIDAGAQAFITGEISEQTVHLAREAGVGFICAGHHATERYGVQALGTAIEKEFGIRVDFVDIDNPV